MASRYRVPAPVQTANVDADYDYTTPAAATPTPTSASAHGVHQNQTYTNGPPPPPPPAAAAAATGNNQQSEDALFDLAQLEELHQEAEKMKALGNKHMAAQEYARAYNAYSAALQLSPVGPSSHVFLSNRAAALLSLKRYQAAATDAKRAIALAPTFGKAHARLGQALYFLKDYPNSIRAYQDAANLEPDNPITQAYLEKAKSKYEKQQKKQLRGEEVSVAGDASTIFTMQNSITTSDHQNVVQSGYRGLTNPAVLKAAAQPAAVASPSSAMPPDTMPPEEDPDFDEALRIQQRANNYLSKKQYKAAIEEYTAALFLVPDDPNLSPELHLGRAHALNGSRRHESARNDAQMAIRLHSHPAAYSTLAKSLFYMKDYSGSVAAFQECIALLPKGESLGMFDKAYLQKAQAATEEEQYSLKEAGTPSSKLSTTPVPKLKPPRFVPREEAIQSTPKVPAMPKQWPKQSKSPSEAFRSGPERTVMFLSESLGIKLNRGADGIVRVLSVTPCTPTSPVARKGTVQAGDVVREAAGVDIRRPITNLMWGDTVALIKLAPRPITFVVAQELSAVPAAVRDELQNNSSPSSRSSGDEPVAINVERVEQEGLQADLTAEFQAEEQAAAEVTPPAGSPENVGAVEEDIPPMAQVEDVPLATGGRVTPETDAPVESIPNSDVDATTADEKSPQTDDSEPPLVVDSNAQPPCSPEATAAAETPATESSPPTMVIEPLDLKNVPTTESESARSRRMTAEAVDLELSLICAEFETTQDANRRNSTSMADVDSLGSEEGDNNKDEEEVEKGNESSPAAQLHSSLPAVSLTPTPDDAMTSQSERPAPPTPMSELSLRDQEEQTVGGEILFDSNCGASCCGWDNLRWMSFAGVRKVRLCQVVHRLWEPSGKKSMFWRSSKVFEYQKRCLAIYSDPQLILVLRRVSDNTELRRLLGLPDIVELDESTRGRYWVVESVADPVVSRLRLSRLTTPTSSGEETPREASCFELITPGESIRLSAVRVREGVKKEEQSFSDSGAFLETTAVETAVKKALCSANANANDIGSLTADIAWMHQVVLGTLHSIVLSGNQKSVEEAISRIKSSLKGTDVVPDSTRLPERFIDPLDENGRTPLYYACTARMTEAVSALIDAGASVKLESTQGMGLAHVCASNLDHKSLSTVLSASHPARPDPNELDGMNRTPMYVAAVKGKAKNDSENATPLSLCIHALEAWGGQMLVDKESPLPNPIATVSAEWRAAELRVLFQHFQYRFPLTDLFETDGTPLSLSLGALFQYPLHAALIALRWQLKTVSTSDMVLSVKVRFQQTLEVLLEHGFEVNERLEYCESTMSTSKELASFVGYTPLQILASIALEMEKMEAQLSDDEYLDLGALIMETTTLLVGNGARTSLDTPPAKRIRGKTSPRKNSVDSDDDLSIDAHRGSLKIDANKNLVELLGGVERLARAKKSFSDLPVVEFTENIADCLRNAESMTLEDSSEPGGNHEKSCAICWCSFGSLVNRKHKCRISRRYLCDDCSTKRVTFEGKEYRLSDGQYALAKQDEAQMKSQREAVRLEQERIDAVRERSRSSTPVEGIKVDSKPPPTSKMMSFRQNSRLSSTSSAESKATPTTKRTLAQIRLDRLAAEEEADRSSLFGGMLDSAAKMFSGEEEDSAARQANNQASGLAASMSQTRNALLERGEKLNTMNEKSAQMVEQSAEFARLAKELRKKSESTNWFGF